MRVNLFKRTKYVRVMPPSVNDTSAVQNVREAQENDTEQKPSIPSGMWIKCETCGQALYRKDLEEHYMTCQFCKTHFRMSARERLQMIVDESSFEEFDADMASTNPLHFEGYDKKLKDLMVRTGLNEAVVTGKGLVNGENTVIAVMDSQFMMGSMGSVVGEKITRAVERATAEKSPLIIFTASGGARMQEGMYSLMQMAKTSAALARHHEAGLLYITVLTDPTTGGVTASFAMLGDIILAEPGALIGFAGQRVIEQTIRQKLPEGFQRAEFLLEHGFVDKVVPREKLKGTLGELLKMHKEASGWL